MREEKCPKSLVSVSNGVELFSNDLRVLEILQSLAPNGVSSLPFYRSREWLGVHE
jgi:hypothetical protein